MRKTLGIGVVLFGCAAFSNASIANIIVNGSFELGSFSSPIYDTVSAGSSAITGWNVDSGSVDWGGNSWTASEGNRLLDMNGFSAGSISQTIFTDAGVEYQLLFDMAGNPGAQADMIKSMRLTVDGYAPQDYSFDATGKTWTNLDWATMTFDFTGIGGATKITFSSLEGSDRGPTLDNVRLNAAPAPVTLSLVVLGLGGIVINRRTTRKRGG